MAGGGRGLVGFGSRAGGPPEGLSPEAKALWYEKERLQRQLEEKEKENSQAWQKVTGLESRAAEDAKERHTLSESVRLLEAEVQSMRAKGPEVRIGPLPNSVRALVAARAQAVSSEQDAAGAVSWISSSMQAVLASPRLKGIPQRWGASAKPADIDGFLETLAGFRGKTRGYSALADGSLGETPAVHEAIDYLMSRRKVARRELAADIERILAEPDPTQVAAQKQKALDQYQAIKDGKSPLAPEIAALVLERMDPDDLRREIAAAAARQKEWKHACALRDYVKEMEGGIAEAEASLAERPKVRFAVVLACHETTDKEGKRLGVDISIAPMRNPIADYVRWALGDRTTTMAYAKRSEHRAALEGRDLPDSFSTQLYLLWAHISQLERAADLLSAAGVDLCYDLVWSSSADPMSEAKT